MSGSFLRRDDEIESRAPVEATSAIPSKRQWYKLSDTGVLPNSADTPQFSSSYEGFPITFFEAWRYEIPIASLHFDLDGLLNEGHGGIRAGSMENLVSGVKRLAMDAKYRAELGAEGRTYMKNNYSLSRRVDLFEEAFQDVLL